jgi:hypothetical protein
VAAGGTTTAGSMESTTPGNGVAGCTRTSSWLARGKLASSPRSALEFSGSLIEQATNRSGRFDHPRVHAETMGTSAISAQLARRTSRRRRRLGWATCRPAIRMRGAAVRRARLISRVLSSGTSIKTTSERGSVRSDRKSGMSAISSAWLMAAPYAPRRPVAPLGSRFQPSVSLVRYPVLVTRG